MSIENSINNLINIDSKELIKIPFVKDLLVKIDVLKNGILSERKKFSSLNAQIKQMETELNNKENEIRKLCKDKVNLESQLEIERKKLAKKEESFLQIATVISQNNSNNKTNNKRTDDEKGMLSFINNNEKIDQLNEEISRLKMENDIFVKKIELNEKMQFEFKKLIQKQADKNLELEEQINTLKKKNESVDNIIEQKENIIRKILNEKEHLEFIIKELKESKDNAINHLKNCLNKCEGLVLANQTYKENLHQHQIDATKLGEKLSEYKNMLIKINTKVQIYHVIKVGLVSSCNIDITFGQDKENNYVIRIDDEKKKVEIVNILDVEYFKQISKNRVEISYMKANKRKKFTVIVEEIIIDQFVDAYKNFFAEAVREQNKLED